MSMVIKVGENGPPMKWASVGILHFLSDSDVLFNHEYDDLSIVFSVLQYVP